MIRCLSVVAALLAVSSLPALGQTHSRPDHAPRRSSQHHDSLTRKFVGTWEGTLESPHGSAEGLKLVIAHDNNTWTAAMTMPPGQPMTTTTISDVKAAANGLTWTQTMRHMSCKGSATLVGGALKGETVCGHLSMGFLLTRK